MRKTLGICVAASLALWLGGCGDDDSACVGSCEEGDASGATTDDSDDTTDTDESDESESTTDTSSSSGEESDAEPTSPETDAGSTSDAPTDGGSEDVDSGTESETDAAVSEGDGGVTADAGDAANEETDSGTDSEDEDAGPVRSEACAAACATGAEADGCEDTAACDSSVCGIEQGNPAHCVDEANAYLVCIGGADPSTDFVCDDGAPTYIGSGCDTELFTWIDCTNTPPE